MNEPSTLPIVAPIVAPPAPKAELVPVTMPPEAPNQSAAEARVEHVNALLGGAYAKASQLKLTDEECAELTEQFPDEAVYRGASGDNELLYVSHSWIRDRLLSVFGPGRWSLIQRRMWGEDYKTRDGMATRLYAECVLVVRGCYVGEAIGAMTYYPGNARSNYSDAAEGAQSEALRRIAGKYLGIGLQVWKKEYCEAWKERNRTGHKREYPMKPASAAPTAKPMTTQELLKPEATGKTLAWMIDQLKGQEEAAKNYAIEQGWLLPIEELADWPLNRVPTSKSELAELLKKISDWIGDNQIPGAEVEEWREFPIPFGKQAGKTLGEVEKNYLFGLWANFEPKETWEGSDGTIHDTKPDKLEADRKFREMLNAAGEHYQFKAEGVTP